LYVTSGAAGAVCANAAEDVAKRANTILDLRFIVFSIEKLRGIHLLSRVRASVEIHKSALFTRTKTQSDAVV
jgi:hypothetical protein